MRTGGPAEGIGACLVYANCSLPVSAKTIEWRSHMTIETVPRTDLSPERSGEDNIRAAIPILDADQVARASQDALARARQHLSRIESLSLDDASVEQVLDAWDDTGVVL